MRTKSFPLFLTDADCRMMSSCAVKAKNFEFMKPNSVCSSASTGEVETCTNTSRKRGSQKTSLKIIDIFSIQRPRISSPFRTNLSRMCFGTPKYYTESYAECFYAKSVAKKKSKQNVLLLCLLFG